MASPYPAGLGPAGAVPVLSPTPGVAFAPPLGLDYDPLTRDAVLLSDGRLRGVLPVDAKVELLLCFPRGSIASVPTHGQTLRSIEYVTPRLDRQVRDAILDALADPIEAGDITVKTIVVQTNVPNARGSSGFSAAVNYVNNRLVPPAKRRTIAFL